MNFLSKVSSNLFRHSNYIFRLRPNFKNISTAKCERSLSSNSYKVSDLSAKLALVEGCNELECAPESDVHPNLEEEKETEFFGSTEDEHYDRDNLQERDVGIRCFLSDHEGFEGIVKRRPEDFIVNEILRNGQVVRLTEQNEAVVFKTSKSEESDKKISTILKDMLPSDVVEKIMDLHNGRSTTPVYINISKMKIAIRNRLHTCFQKHLPKVVARTEVIQKEKFWCIKSTSDPKPEIDAQVKIKPSHVHFALYKINKASFEAHYEICRILNIPHRTLCVAGLKDKKSVSCQIASVEKNHLSVENIRRVNQRSNIKIGNFVLKKEPIMLGDLYGNHFEIIIRDVKTLPDSIEKALTNVQSKGFVNYFGLQRFGQLKPSYMTIGLKILQKNWQEAVELILQPRDHPETATLTKCRQVWWDTRNPRKALKCLDGNLKFSREGLLLKGLDFCGATEFMSALNTVPKAYLKFYVHSFSSFLWNSVVSARLEKYGSNVLEGDTYSKLGTNLDQVYPVRRQDLENLDISQVVYPTAGNRISIPDNEFGDMYREILTANGLSEEFINSNEVVHILGTHRPLIAFPENLQWSFVHYDNEDEILSLTDYNKLQGDQAVTSHNTSGQRIALKLEFDLKACCYATMALREIMKT